MRRKNKECNDPQFFEEVFQKAKELFLAMHDGDYPYCLPLNFVFMDNKIYIHCAKEGHKLDCIQKDAYVAFSLCADTEIDLQKSTTYYKSICGTGIATIIEDTEEKRAALDSIAKRYKAHCSVPAKDSDVERTGIIRIDIQELTGKHSKRKNSTVE